MHTNIYFLDLCVFLLFSILSNGIQDPFLKTMADVCDFFFLNKDSCLLNAVNVEYKNVYMFMRF